MFPFKTHYKKLLADTLTPVSTYLKLRDRFPNSILLESSDYHSGDQSFSYICCNPVASIKVASGKIIVQLPDGSKSEKTINNKIAVIEELEAFASFFQLEKSKVPFISQGLFGYMAYDSVQYFEDISITKKSVSDQIPDIFYSFYSNVIAIDHFRNEAHIFNYSPDDSHNLEEILQLINNTGLPKYPFSRNLEKTSNLTDDQFRSHIRKAKTHIQRGDVFQLVLSRSFSQKFKGDDFNVYRALRSINPSPYLFYFDYGDFKLFGSSPEAHLVVRNRQMEIHPIAGTFKRTGNDEQDAELARKLASDKKENAEHVMLVDLARNDLSRNATNVKVETFAQLQFFSHVIHLVSKVTGKLRESARTLNAVAGTFPAGTLSGAPKYRAMELIEEIESTSRGFYGGAIGFMDFDGNFNHAILIRTFLSKDHRLRYQAGAGITINSNEDSELQEVYNKLAALDKAILLAEEIN
ncbi:anthranilate synthase component I family protein [Flavobacterium silvaticum]|uniref:Anthranilate synthase component 1 n=1 Tax=Flavobacterium silvaticum TaxID=1852020 RepID=A0A972FIU2_9FLAO|nr:anthranilate synthase component I family protein [Flavobacterium silvaticum]NMH26814.1 anthranilate synthase component I family protein [Flavobacterium silvaticum]